MTDRKKLLFFLGTTLFFVTQASLADVDIPMYMVAESGNGTEIGSVTASNSTCGLLLTPNLHDLPPGLHGFHVHTVPDCSKRGMAAGGHLDPQNKGAHKGPYHQDGHLGDLPVLIVDNNGKATLPTLAPKFKLKDLQGHALIIHAGSDNYSDTPEKLGGGGDRIACGVIAK